MPTYEITSPDGTKLRVTAPDGASPDEVLRFVQTQAPTLKDRQQAQIEADRKEYDPTKDMSWGGKFDAGYGKAASDLVRGVGQRLGMVSQEDADERKRLDAALMNTGAGMTGNIIGNIAAAIPTAFVPGANTMLGSAGVGGLYGLAQPTATGESPWRNALESGAMSGLLTGLVRAVPGLYNAFAAPFRQQGQTDIALNTLSRFAHDPNAIAKMGVPREIVPGSRPTLAEATGDPGLAQLQRTVQSRSLDAASEFSNMKEARQAARKKVLTDIAGDADDRLMAVEAREAVADDLYNRAFAETPVLTPWIKGQITELQKRPSIANALPAAKERALEKGLVLDENNVTQVLHFTKMALDDQIASLRQAGKGGLASDIQKTRDKLVSLMESKDFSPSYREARSTYAAMSKPINQMDVGRALYEKLVPALSDTGEKYVKENANEFAKSILRKGDQTAALATGYKGAKLDRILEPEQLEAVKSVAKDLARAMEADQAGAITGSRTAQYAAGQNVLREVLAIGIPQKWAAGIADTLLADTFATRLISSAAKPVEERIQKRLMQLMLDPVAAQRAQANLLARAARPTSQAARIATPAIAIGAGSYAAQ